MVLISSRKVEVKKMADKPGLAKCGSDCRRCPAFKGNTGTEEDRQRGSEIWHKYFGLNFKPDTIKCAGCQSISPWKTGNMLPSKMCKIRACAIYNKVDNCAYCAVFPCQEFLKVVPGPDLRRQREEAGQIKISDAEYQEYLEPFEGQTHLKKIHSQLSPAELTQPGLPSTSVKILPCPDSATADLKILHSRLAAIFSTKAATYAAQRQIETSLTISRAILWAMGLYGKMEDGRLVITSAENGSIKVCNKLVRKADNRLHDLVQQAADDLARAGIKLIFTPLKKAWRMQLGIDGPDGARLLEALSGYTHKLVEKYGEPAYIDGFNLKGTAFKLFAQLEMSCVV
jgi:hypothetical protein